MKETISTVPQKGVGRRDDTHAIEQAVQPYSTVVGRQMSEVGTGEFWLPGWLVFPAGYRIAHPMPQSDGTWGNEAELIPVITYTVELSTNTSALMLTSWDRYASLANFMAGILAERFALKYGYGNVKIHFPKGIKTQPGSVYSQSICCWPGYPFGDFYYACVQAHSIVTELTAPWMSF